jgi:hypothetical protein
MEFQTTFVIDACWEEAHQKNRIDRDHSSHVRRRLAVLAEIRLRANNLRFEKLEYRHRLARRTVP